MMAMEKLPVKDIIADPSVQARAGTDPDTVAEYADAFRDGSTFPPVVLFLDPDGKRYWLADGFHRLAAAVAAELAEVEAEVRKGTKRHAMLFAAGANATHGLPRKPEDKRRAVFRLLQDDEWSKWSDREIAKVCKVSHTFVDKLRAGLTGNVASEKRTFTSKHGTQATMKVANIGRQSVDGLDADGNPALDPRFDYWREGTIPGGECFVELAPHPELAPTGEWWVYAISHRDSAGENWSDYCGRGIRRRSVLEILQRSLKRIGFNATGPWQPLPVDPSPPECVKWRDEDLRGWAAGDANVGHNILDWQSGKVRWDGEKIVETR